MSYMIFFYFSAFVRNINYTILGCYKFYWYNAKRLDSYFVPDVWPCKTSQPAHHSLCRKQDRAHWHRAPLIQLEALAPCIFCISQYCGDSARNVSHNWRSWSPFCWNCRHWFKYTYILQVKSAKYICISITSLSKFPSPRPWCWCVAVARDFIFEHSRKLSCWHCVNVPS